MQAIRLGLSGTRYPRIAKAQIQAIPEGSKRFVAGIPASGWDAGTFLGRLSAGVVALLLSHRLMAGVSSAPFGLSLVKTNAVIATEDTETTEKSRHVMNQTDSSVGCRLEMAESPARDDSVR